MIDEELFRRIIDKQFEIAGIDLIYEDILRDKEWFRNNTMTTSQNLKLKEWFIGELKKKRISKSRAVVAWEWFDLGYGLKIKDNDK